ncbi:MAG: methionine adenosyltransferase [Ruminococcaceae bacterium]|nr:methionine adenosyltransferase [Oscillospiraceae bacterium]
MNRYLFSSESVTEGHPDKICDIISDSILDAIIARDRNARVACEVMVKNRHVIISGEISSSYIPNIKDITRNVIRDIGYNDKSSVFSSENADIRIYVSNQSPDIALGVDLSYESKNGSEKEIGAGDQGMVFGYACSDTPELMPLPIQLSHEICRRLSYARKRGEIPYLKPDGKSQVTVEYENDLPSRVAAVVVSAQHEETIELERLRKDIKDKIIMRSSLRDLVDAETKYFINPTGRFVVGGPQSDTGLSGRKIIVDTYGGAARHGGGSFSGKDPTKVDRSASYMARYVAKNVVASGVAKKCEVQISYAIGVANPISVYVKTDRTSQEDSLIVECINEVFDLRPEAILNCLNLRRPIYKQLASYGHIGRTDIDLSWEKTDRAEKIKTLFESKQ